MNRTRIEPRERLVVWLWCAVASVHVFLFSAAFPFFNIVDEQAHFDLVLRYADGKVPRAYETTGEEAALYIAAYGTPEYFWPESYFTNGVPPPMWVAPDRVRAHVLDTAAYWKTQVNHESAQPPLYYALAGAFWRLARLGGFSEGGLLYALRFLNILFVGALVWSSFAAARLVFPENRFLRLGVPAIVAFLPQTTFYSINNDALSPLGSCLLFIGIVRLYRTDAPTVKLGLFSGLAFAAVYLTKLSNAPVLAVAGVAVCWRTWEWFQNGKLRNAAPALAGFWSMAALPIAAWVIWTKVHFGDVTGSAGKVGMLGWTVKPLAEWWAHPMFTPGGAWTFVSGLLATFWQGEFLWHGRPLAFPSVNLAYTTLSLLGLGVAAVCLGAPRLRPPDPAQRRALQLAFWSLAASGAFLAVLSLAFDFHDCFYPSREHPYFTSGRLLGGAMVPFLLLWLYGIDRLLAPVKIRGSRWIALAAMLGFMLAAEIAVSSPVFPNPYNWFHM